MASIDHDTSTPAESVSESTDIYKTGFVAIIGRPNVGKSTLMNALLHERLSIVTSKPQTTRQRILGILTEPGHQVLFMDTPGLLEPGYTLQEYMMRSAIKTIQEADVTIAMMDGTRGLKDLNKETVNALTHSSGPVILAINKIDRIKKPQLLPIIAEAGQRFPFSRIIPISALHDEGLSDLLADVIEALPEGPALYPPDTLTDQPERFFVAEIVREHLFLQLQHEVPYASAVRVDEFAERTKGKLYIQATIIIEKESQKGIVIGRKGQMLKQIGIAAKDDIEAFLDRPVYLDLWVRVQPTWRKRETELKRLGYV